MAVKRKVESLDPFFSGEDVKDFLSRCSRPSDNECWTWQLRSPMFRGMSAHRASYRMFRGPADKPWIRRCPQDGRCVNPDHLKNVTASESVEENLRLGKKMGRPAGGFTYAEVRRLHFGPARLEVLAIAKKFNRHVEEIEGIISTTTWK